MLSLSQLEVFHAVAQAGSMTAAAAALSVSQPAVSKQIRQLEVALSVKLVDRGVRQSTLTQAGHLLASHARRIFAIVNEADRALADLSALRRGSLVIGATPTLGAYLLPEALIHFRRRFPAIQTKLEIGTAGAIGTLIAEGSIDVALSGVTLDSVRAASTPFASEDLVIIAPAGHPLARRKSVGVERLANEPFIVREVGSTSRSFAERAMATRGVKLHATLSLASTEAIKRAVAGGLGLAIVPAVSITSEVAARRLSIVKVPRLALRRPIYLTAPRDATRSRPAIAFLYLLKHALRGSLPKLAPNRGMQTAAKTAAK